MNLSHILVATDFSDCGNRAVQRAALIAAQQGATLRIVHALPGAALTWQLLRVQGMEVESLLRNAVEVLLKELGTDIQSRLHVDVTHDVGTGAAHRVIVDAVETHQPDLLVIGAHGEGIVQQVLLGGTAGRLLAHGTHPVLVVRRVAEGPYRKVVAAVDLGIHTQAVLDATRSIAPMARLQAVHAFHAPFERQLRLSGVSEQALQQYRDEERTRTEERFTQWLPEDGPIERIVRDGRPTSVLLEWVAAHDTDLIVASRHGGTRFADIVLGSVPRFLAFHAVCDVLVM